MNRNTWIIIIVAVIVIIGLIWIFNRGVPARAPSVPPTSDATLLVDVTTGCQYDYIKPGQITPRLDRLGYPLCDKD